MPAEQLIPFVAVPPPALVHRWGQGAARVEVRSEEAPRAEGSREAAREGAPLDSEASSPPTSPRVTPPAVLARPTRELDLSLFGPLSPPLADAAVTDVFLNPDGTVWSDAGAGAQPQAGVRVPAGAARDLAVRLIAAGGRHVDEATPCVDVRLASGVRAHVVLPPVSTGAAAISLRVPRQEPPGLDDLERGGAFDAADGARLRELVARRANVLISGAGGSGKTTLLAALLAAAPGHERIVVLEDVAELRIAHPHVVALEARQPNLEGAGGIRLDGLVREALRMRPDRLVVGECRGAELRELLSALNTGHDGGAGTIHANSLADVPARLEALGAVAGLAAEAVARQAVSAIDGVLHVERAPEGRRLAAIGRLELDGSGRLRVAEWVAE